MEEAEIQNSLLWVSKALVPTIMARTCRVMAWDAVVAAQRSNVSDADEIRLERH